MTKKVLISLDELQEMCCDSVIFNEGAEDYDIDNDSIKKWFDAQPDFKDLLHNATQDFQEHMKKVLSKMRTTGSM